jgi:hypothetical protein
MQVFSSAVRVYWDMAVDHVKDCAIGVVDGKQFLEVVFSIHLLSNCNKFINILLGLWKNIMFFFILESIVLSSSFLQIIVQYIFVVFCCSHDSV